MPFGFGSHDSFGAQQTRLGERTKTPTLVQKVVPSPKFLGPPLCSPSREHWGCPLHPHLVRDVENAQGLGSLDRYSRLQSTNCGGSILSLVELSSKWAWT